MAMIEIDALAKSFGPVAAVRGVSLSVEKGEVLGFLGPNGAGKSTTMKMATGFLSPSSGSARICGFDVQSDPLPARARLGYLPEGAPAYGDMTPRGFLAFCAAARGMSGAAARDAIASAAPPPPPRPALGHTHVPATGFRRRVGLAQAFLPAPPVLIMDEPTDGLDPNQKHAVRALIAEMAPHKAIIVSTHILEEVAAICTRAVIIDRGRIVADGRIADGTIAFATTGPDGAPGQVSADARDLDGVFRALTQPQAAA